MKDEEFVAAFAAAVSAALVRRKLTAAELARRSGLPHDTVSHYLAGRREPRLSHARKLCRGLGITLAQLDKMLPEVAASQPPAAKPDGGKS